MRRLLTGLSLAVALSGPVAAAAPDRDAAIVARGVNDYIRPAMARFADDALALDGATTRYCDTPSTATRPPLDAAFKATVQGWSGIQFLRFGPLSDAHRLERIAFWPDPKGVGLRQIRRAIADRDPTVLDPAQLAGKSVALQGLTALEYLLYGGDGDPAGAAGDAGAFRCGYAVAAARSLTDLADAMKREWADPNGFAKRLLAPGGSDPLYRTPSEALSELHRALGTGLQVVQDQKLKPALGDDANSARPLGAPFRRSGLTLTVLAADMRALKAFAADADFTRDVADEDRWLGDSMAFEFDNAAKAAEAVTLPIEEAVLDETARGKLGYLYVVLGHLRDMTQTDLATALDLKVGFNALDGD